MGNHISVSHSNDLTRWFLKLAAAKDIHLKRALFLQSRYSNHLKTCIEGFITTSILKKILEKMEVDDTPTDMNSLFERVKVNPAVWGIFINSMSSEQLRCMLMGLSKFHCKHGGGKVCFQGNRKDHLTCLIRSFLYKLDFGRVSEIYSSACIYFEANPGESDTRINFMHSQCTHNDARTFHSLRKPSGPLDWKNSLIDVDRTLFKVNWDLAFKRFPELGCRFKTLVGVLTGKVGEGKKKPLYNTKIFGLKTQLQICAILDRLDAFSISMLSILHKTHSLLMRPHSTVINTLRDHPSHIPMDVIKHISTFLTPDTPYVKPLYDDPNSIPDIDKLLGSLRKNRKKRKRSGDVCGPRTCRRIKINY